MCNKYYKLEKKDVSNFALSFNTIKVLKVDNEIKFFRECPQHKPFHDFYKDLVNTFCDTAINGVQLANFEQKLPYRINYSKEEVDDFLQYMKRCMERNNFFKKVKNMNYVLKTSLFNPWNGNLTISDASALSIGFLPWKEKNEELLAYFYSFINSHIINYQFHDFISNKGGFETFYASRQLASYELSLLLGLERLIVPTTVACVEIEGERHYGCMCDKALGKRGLDCIQEISPALQRELTNLKILDVLCFQDDHFANNYNVVCDDQGNAVSVCAFDNDANRTFWIDPSIGFVSKYHGCELVTHTGEYAWPFLDKETAQVLSNIDMKKVRKRMSPYLNQLQIWALEKRISKLQESIKRRMKCDKNFLKAEDEWNEQTLNEELSGKYGLTYTLQYVYKADIKEYRRPVCLIKEKK